MRRVDIGVEFSDILVKICSDEVGNSIIVDRETGVMYLQTEKNNGYGISVCTMPLLDSSGKPKLLEDARKRLYNR